VRVIRKPAVSRVFSVHRLGFSASVFSRFFGKKVYASSFKSGTLTQFGVFMRFTLAMDWLLVVKRLKNTSN